MGDKLLIFEDTDGDGKADKCTTFLDDLNCPTGFQFYKDGVLVMQAPDLWFVRDTDGDGKADWKERVLMGLDSADSHHTANAICSIRAARFTSGRRLPPHAGRDRRTAPVRNNDAAIFRFEPRTGRSSRPTSPTASPTRTAACSTAGARTSSPTRTGNNTYFGPAFSGRIDYPASTRA